MDGSHNDQRNNYTILKIINAIVTNVSQHMQVLIKKDSNERRMWLSPHSWKDKQTLENIRTKENLQPKDIFVMLFDVR